MRETQEDFMNEKMAVWSFFGLVVTLGLSQVLTPNGFLAWC